MKRESANFDALMTLAAEASMAEEIKEFDSVDETETAVYAKTERRILRESRKKNTRHTWVHALAAAAACMLLYVGLFGVVRANQKEITVQWDETSFSYELRKDWSDDSVMCYPDVPEGWYLIEQLGGWRMEGPNGEVVELRFAARKGTIDADSVRVEEIVLKNNLPAYRVILGRETNFFLLWKDKYYFRTRFINVTLEQALEIIDTLGPRS